MYKRQRERDTTNFLNALEEEEEEIFFVVVKKKKQKSSSLVKMPRSRRTMCLATVSLIVLLSSSFGTTAVDASKTKNKALLQEKYGIDCGSHCTNAVVRLHEAKIEQEKCVVVVVVTEVSFCFLSNLMMMRDRRF